MTSPFVGALLGLTLGLGIAQAVRGLPVVRRVRLADRVDPYLRESRSASRLLARRPTTTPLPSLERILRPVLSDAARAVDRWAGGSASVRRRLAQSGSGLTLLEFRAEQVMCAAAGLAAGLALVLLRGATGIGPPVVSLLGACLLLTLGGALARDGLLTRAVARRETRIAEELPAVAELLALAVVAGEGLTSALSRVARVSGGELGRELGLVLADVRAGAPLVTALEAMTARTSLVALSRFVDGIAVAVRRGTPLAEVLRAQAEDAREAGRRRLMEAGGRREIAMLVPVVFLVLPVTVLFVVYPGLLHLDVVAH